MNTVSVVDLSRRIAEALADDRVARHRDDRPDPSPEEERRVAWDAAMRIIDVGRPGPFGSAAPSSDESRRLIEEAIARVCGLGRLEPLLADDDITDIHVRGNRPVWVKTLDGRREERPAVVDSDRELVDLVRRIASRMCGREHSFDSSSPEVNLRLPDGSRLFAAMDVSSRPTMVIRRHRFEYSTVDDLRRTGMMDDDTARFLVAAVRARKNLIIAGGTGSGKTTLLRALINEVPREERIVTIEDAYEIGLENFEDLHPDHDALQSRPPNTEGRGEITLADLTRMALRMDPDRVVVGEVRGPEALPMLLAMSQGNNGSMCTIHADSSRTVFPKLVAYVSMGASGIPAETVNLLVASAVHLVVHVEMRGNRRVVASVREVVDADGLTVVSNEVFGSGTMGAGLVTARRQTLADLEPHGYVPRGEPAWS
ncbi:MAG: CpaF family protein [Solirubrobacterales bacterium]